MSQHFSPKDRSAALHLRLCKLAGEQLNPAEAELEQRGREYETARSRYRDRQEFSRRAHPAGKGLHVHPPVVTAKHECACKFAMEDGGVKAEIRRLRFNRFSLDEIAQTLGMCTSCIVKTVNAKPAH